MACKQFLPIALLVIATFLTAPQAGFAADSLVVNPVQPTVADSITLTIVIPNWDCCTQYTFDSTLAPLEGDTAVLLSYQHYLPAVCPTIACPDVPKLLKFKRAPLPAGTYAVYESAQTQCVTNVCPALVLAPVKIGSFTVSASTGIAQRQAGLKPVSGEILSGRRAVYNIRGELVDNSTGRQFRGILISRLESGMFVVENNLAK